MNTHTLLRAFGALVLGGALLLPAQSAVALDRAAALTAARAGQWEQAGPALEALAAAESTDVEVCALLVPRFLDQRRHKEAVQLAERAVAAAPQNADLHALLGRAYGARIGELAFIQQGFVAPKMRHAFERAVELEPNHVTGLIGLANFHLYSPAIAGGSHEKAEEYALRVEKIDPFNGALARARIRERQENWAEAAACYRAAVAAQPQNPWAQSQLGGALAKAGQKAEAKLAFEAALQLAPDFAPAREGLAALTAAPAS